MPSLVLVRPKMNFAQAMPNPPIGLGYLAAMLRKNGHQVQIIDCAIIKKSYPQILSKLKKLSPDLIGITALTIQYNEMRELINYLQKMDVPIILGGVHVSSLPELSLRESNAELVVLGEGELTLSELLNIWERHEKRKTIKGIAYIKNNQFIKNPPRELIQNLDDIPFPAWDLINPLNYPHEPQGGMKKRSPVAPIITTRGCPYSCSYCASTNFWNKKYRRRSPQNVVDEIEYLVNTFGIQEIHVWDDNFTLSKKHVIGICREILQRKLDLTFACPNGVRIDSLDKELLTIMKRTGFYSITFAVESGNQSILERANKKIDLKKIPKIAKLAKSLGFFIPSFFMFGLPGETYETARRSIEFAKSLPLDHASFLIAQPLPGSSWFKEWIKDKDLGDLNYEAFNFIRFKNVLKFSDGKKTLKVPSGATREFFFRPIQILRYLKYWVHTFHHYNSFTQLRRLMLEYTKYRRRY